MTTETAAQRTPAPWGVNMSNPLEVLDQRGIEICEMLPDVGYPDDANGHANYSRNQAIENARLIAAAPELLEAARILAGLDSGNGRTFPTYEQCAQASAAIAKAEGRS